MIVVQNHIPVNENFREEFEQRFSKRNGGADNFPGFVRNDILRPNEGNKFVVMTFCRGIDDFHAWHEVGTVGEAGSSGALAWRGCQIQLFYGRS